VLKKDTRTMKAYVLVQDKGGVKVKPVEDGAAPGPLKEFQGDMRQLAALISIRLTIAIPADPTKPGIAGGTPAAVIDKTGLTGVYNLDRQLRMEPGADNFGSWQRTLQDQLGLKLDSRNEPVDILTVQSAEKTPVAN